jgi:hypothetical protein
LPAVQPFERSLDKAGSFGSAVGLKFDVVIGAGLHANNNKSNICDTQIGSNNLAFFEFNDLIQCMLISLYYFFQVLPAHRRPFPLV